MSELPNGTSARVHAEYSLAEIQARVTEAAFLIQRRTRLKTAERQALARRLAGAIGHLETLRIWLNAGAPE